MIFLYFRLTATLILLFIKVVVHLAIKFFIEMDWEVVI